MNEIIKSILNFLFSNSLFSLFAFLVILPVNKFWLKKDYNAQSVLFILVLVRLFFPVGQIFSFNPVSYVYSASDLNLNLNIFTEPDFISPLNESRQSFDMLNHDMFIFLLWIIGILVFLFLIMYKRYFYHSLQKKAIPVLNQDVLNFLNELKKRYKISRRIKILVSRTNAPPFTFGVFNPVIIIPQKIKHDVLSNEIKAVLAHEMVHIKRFDAIRIFFLGFVQAVYFFNPVVWIIARKLNLLREIQCDHFILKYKIIQPSVLGKVLLSLSGSSKNLPLTFILALTGFKNHLKKRLMAMKGENHMTVNRILFSITAILISSAMLSMSQPIPVKIQETAKIVSDKGFANPLKEMKVTSGFGMRKHPVLKKMMKHQGIDLSAQKGTAVYSISEGKVIEAAMKGNYGNTVVIQHADNVRSLYAQLSEILVKKGQVIKKGEVIGKAGSSGLSTAPHLHFEIREKNQPVNPAEYLDLN